MTTYEWKIPNLEYYPVKDNLDKVVHVIHWIIIGTNGKYQTSEFGVQTVNTDSLNPDNYVPFDQLTQEIVVGWLENAMGPDRVNQIKDNIENKINDLINPPNVLAPAPWDQ